MQCLYQETQLHGSARNIASFAAGKEVLLEIMEPGRDRIYQIASLLVDSICTRHVSHYDKLVTCHVCLTDHCIWNGKFQSRYISMAVLNSNCGDMIEGSRVTEDPRDAYPQRNVSLRPRSLGEISGGRSRFGPVVALSRGHRSNQRCWPFWASISSVTAVGTRR